MTIPSLLLHLLLVLLVPPLMQSCSEPETNEQIILKYVAEVEEAVEQRNRRALIKLVSDRYLDPSKRTKQDILAITSGYILRNKSIYCFTKIESVSQLQNNVISARVLAALASKPITDISLLPTIKSDIYWFDVIISLEDKSWRLTDASWQQAMLEDFL